MAKAKKLPSGNWRVQASVTIDGKTIRKSFTKSDKKQAEISALEWQNKIFKYCDEPTQLTLGEAMERYIESRRNILSPVSIATYEKIKRNYFTKLQDKPINTIEEISAAEHCETTDYIYIFYTKGCYVNVYDTSGDFKWAAQIPSQQNGKPIIVFHQDKLLFSFWDTYIIDAARGELIEVKKDKEADEIYEVTDSNPVDFSATKVEYFKNGKTNIIVKKSPVTFILQPAVGGLIAVFGALMLIIGRIVINIKSRNKRKK